MKILFACVYPILLASARFFFLCQRGYYTSAECVHLKKIYYGILLLNYFKLTIWPMIYKSKRKFAWLRYGLLFKTCGKHLIVINILLKVQKCIFFSNSGILYVFFYYFLSASDAKI